MRTAACRSPARVAGLSGRVVKPADTQDLGSCPARGAGSTPASPTIAAVRATPSGAARFVAEPVHPDRETFATSLMAAGEPGLPGVFRWRGGCVRVVGVTRRWRETGPCRHGSGERYARRHWYEVLTDSGQVMVLYCDRHVRRGDRGGRWWLYTVADAGEGRREASGVVPGAGVEPARL